MPATKELFKKYYNPIFIETGAALGDGIQAAIDAGFKKIYSIEIDPFFYEHCKDRFKELTDVHIILGDSDGCLEKLLETINEPITFWLDAHHVGGFKRGNQISPLLQEIEAINKHPVKTHTLIIDDLRDWSIGWHGFDTDILKQNISLINSDYFFIFEDGIVPHDILVAKAMKKVKFFYNYPIDICIETDKNIEVYIDQFNESPISDDVIRIIVLEEPKKCKAFYLVQNKPECYTYVLTFQEELLTNNPKARLLHFPNGWVKGYVSAQKQFCVSTVVGGKTDPEMLGYELRHNLWRNSNLITIPRDFYLSDATNPHYSEVTPRLDNSGAKILGSSKNPMFDSMFHIAIENTLIKNYFSEKLLDCFLTKTLPIYYGCINIGDYFNIEGIIVANNMTEIVEGCNRLTPEIYYRKLAAMEDNLNRAQQWINGKEQLKKGIIKLLNEI
jgi:hypothetical protein